MHLLIASATGFEIAPLEEWLQANSHRINNFSYRLGHAQIDLLITGVGIPLSAYSFGRLFAKQSYDLAIQAGIAGALDRNLEIGEVVQVTSESFGDLGVEEADGSFTSAISMGLIDANQPPFVKGLLPSPTGTGTPSFLKSVTGTTVMKVHGQEESITAFRNRTDAQVESMEGASFAYACLLEQQPFLQIRAISNYVEKRNRDAWDIPLAIGNLNQVLMDMVQILAATGRAGG
ncbi:futalosine hydrolase [Flavilitoribacter nigricans]|uniref:Futalosine hydrolase n=1 Tax=Flavilitoribacter nigricans (strain ATCC 23147 / DSM 23189 / NBRC 102662 / NCIMB 1420 / SS-2) TaxID=1122177 RepID=A0A2D0NDX0_FLAN2|nr:futalosine hydrolase [Flavilitoribacter nigricans]PHN05963.1 futalosine hydrolase [Flavilitoribacter nigricans DSM 23189 = NBRC 102662]